tara:strand:- start:710 stop:3328 length:2619 start_codon:yes stop_codon:yes gene_type:complete
MIIKKWKKKKEKSFFSFNKFLYLYFFSSVIIGMFIFIAILKSQTFTETKEKYLDYFSKGGRLEYIYLPSIAIKAFKSNFYKIDKVELEITFEDMLMLENVRKKAILVGTDAALPDSSQMPNVKTNIIFKDKKYRGDIRLKGDRKIHYVDKKKSSYKIDLDKDQYILGIKKFSIQKPRARNYVHEWIFHELAADFNIIKIKYEFVDLVINGEKKGLYVIEEGFGKELIERNERRNGPIFGLDENIYAGYDDQVWEIYNKKYWNKDENLPLVKIASQKLTDFFEDKIELEKVFDLEKWAAFFAVMDLSQNYHGAFLKSVKFYYNPLNGLFEPIPFDGHRMKHNYHKYHLNYDNSLLIDYVEDSLKNKSEQFSWIQKFFYKNNKINQDFYGLYLDNLNIISSDNYIDKFLSTNLKEIEKINSHIYADYFYFDNISDYGVGLYYFLLDDFKHQANNIKDKLKIQRKTQVLKKNDSKFLIKNYYKNYGLFFVDKFLCSKNDQKFEIKINKSLNNFSDTIVELPQKLNRNLKCNHVKLTNKHNNNSILLKIDHINSKYDYDLFKQYDPQIIKKYFVKKGTNFYLIEDEINIDQNLYIPNGFKFFVKPGQKIILTNNSFIISNSPWIIGGEGKKTIITGEKNNFGGGMYIGETSKLSRIQNTEFSYLTGNKHSSEFLVLGSINFHDTSVDIKNVNFNNIFSEDAINIFRSKFKIQNGIYSNIASDAIDIDFSDGEIKDIKFKNIKNDAIDFSGSNAIVNNCYFDNVYDKIISVGEKSKVNISEIKAINSFVGIVSKDGSRVYTNNISFDDVKIPFAAYQKKKEYNHGVLIAKNSNFHDFFIKWIKDKKSKMTINNKLVEKETKKILPIIYEKKLFLLNQ